MSLPLLYTELADWFHLLTRPEDYAEEAGTYVRVIRTELPDAHTMLELGSGGGNNARHLKREFAMTLSDLSPAMLEISQRLNPELPHRQGDMRTVRLGMTFDVVFIHDAIAYQTTEDDLSQTLRTAYLHTRPGGLLLVMPDFTRETFRAGTSQGGHDGECVSPPQPGRALRYLEWVHDPDPLGTSYVVDFAYLLKEGDDMSCRSDRHVLGLFPVATWLRLIGEAGFRPSVLDFEHSEVEGARDMFLGRRPG